MTAFETQIAANIKAQIKSEKRNGVTGIGLDCLRQVTRTDNLYGLAGELSGTNAAYYYAEKFRDIVSRLKECRGFVRD